MKKYLAIMMCAGLLLTATGCGDEEKEDDSSKKDSTKVEEKEKKEEKAKSKVLSCSESYEDEMSMEQTYVFDSKGKELLDVNYSFSIKVDDEYLEDVTDKDVNEFCDELGDSKSIKKCSAKLEGNKIVAELKYDIDKLDEEEDGFTKDTTIDKLKETIEEEFEEEDRDGITCKIEEK